MSKEVTSHLSRSHVTKVQNVALVTHFIVSRSLLRRTYVFHHVLA